MQLERVAGKMEDERDGDGGSASAAALVRKTAKLASEVAGLAWELEEKQNRLQKHQVGTPSIGNAKRLCSFSKCCDLQWFHDQRLIPIACTVHACCHSVSRCGKTRISSKIVLKNQMPIGRLCGRCL